MPPDKTLKEETPILSLIQEIKDGRVDARLIGKDERQGCIEVLIGEGYNVPQIAQTLKRCEKTIRRDLDGIRARNAISPDTELAKKIVGDMLMYVRTHRDYLMRLARKGDASVSEKAQAEFYAAQLDLNLIAKLQSLGYLPYKDKNVCVDLFTKSVLPPPMIFFEDREEGEEPTTIEKY